MVCEIFKTSWEICFIYFRQTTKEYLKNKSGGVLIRVVSFQKKSSDSAESVRAFIDTIISFSQIARQSRANNNADNYVLIVWHYKNSSWSLKIKGNCGECQGQVMSVLDHSGLDQKAEGGYRPLFWRISMPNRPFPHRKNN